ncbi:MAG: hypothetical protein GY863_20660 [bacterium]|nr:hypothetical protein [bacterium]
MNTSRKLILSLFLIISAVSFLGFITQSSKLGHLKDPKISTKKNETMIVVEAKGDPNVAGAKAFGLLFQLYYSIKETPKGPYQAAPRARWPESLETEKTEWVGLYAMSVPETVKELPKHESQEGVRASLVTWEYGEVAEILHIGPYDKEEPTINRLKDFISDQGYETVGGHEEEYIKGPNMYGKGDPEKFETIIRYRIKKTDRE